MYHITVEIIERNSILKIDSFFKKEFLSRSVFITDLSLRSETKTYNIYFCSFVQSYKIFILQALEICLFYSII